jgi:hypothetical protein
VLSHFFGPVTILQVSNPSVTVIVLCDERTDVAVADQDQPSNTELHDVGRLVVLHRRSSSLMLALITSPSGKPPIHFF